MNIIPYKPGDYALLANLWEEAGLPYKSEGRDSKEKIEKEVKLNCNRFLFAVIDGKYVGAVLATHDGRKGWINRVAVIPEFQRRGIARKLVEAAEQWLDDQQIGIVACMIEGYNDESYEVFRKLGYIPFEGVQYLTKRKFPGI